MSHKQLEPFRNDFFRKLLVAGPIFILFIYFMSILFGKDTFISLFPLIGSLYAIGLFCFFIPISSKLMESDILKVKTVQKLILSAIYPTVSIIFMCLIVMFMNQETLLIASLALGILVYSILTLVRDNSEIFSIIGMIILNITWYIVGYLIVPITFRF